MKAKKKKSFDPYMKLTSRDYLEYHCCVLTGEQAHKVYLYAVGLSSRLKNITVLVDEYKLDHLISHLTDEECDKVCAYAEEVLSCG